MRTTTSRRSISLFSASQDAESLIRLFCLFVAGSFVFNGALFVANAAFNNLGFPLYATLFNWGRATLGVIPFVAVGKAYGPEGILTGWGLGAVVFGLGAAVVAFRVIKLLPERAAVSPEQDVITPAAQSPFTSGKGANIGSPAPRD